MSSKPPPPGDRYAMWGVDLATRRPPLPYTPEGVRAMADLMRRNTIKASDLEWASPVAIWWRPVGGIDGPVMVMWGRLKPRKSIAGLKTFTVAEWTHHGAKGWWPSDFPPPADGLPAPGAPPTSEK